MFTETKKSPVMESSSVVQLDPTVADAKKPSSIESPGVSDSTQTPIAEIVKESEAEILQRKNNSEALLNYFKKFGSVEVLSSSKLLEKEEVNVSDSAKILARLEEILVSVTEQYQELLEILPEDERDLLPRFAEKPWPDKLREKILAQPFFSGNDIVGFTVRAENLSNLARQVKDAQKILSVRIVTKAVAEIPPAKREAA
ncbi:MAG: hypothetical protein UX09_C0004G0013 [Candidatus Uhrbacteria bacterium GW2011_GWE2_45_35]|uniref:Uncharacterized protein n=2 Tax=Candidatus Uhriibacteriota TaxID=1752732 RepID=A0A0G1LT62_9BACT|nr:MAG: hypothetical protein UW63_C0002G0015 [Candidatus Uhrbacteria bacterium GW2011_GWF2_44_350]KKU09093.1 MAG: hypothetical protein UX09_C0004G0013 [Candidatus Uhrbacteria bacterium GW2011_GWE2_45_35]HBR80344.1 hypothetical protein [Candidatus Uhrbacteria bacterium]HCU31289.1 hypothetical protein [Candidatus Uhrbacteria bacterium]